MSSVTRCGEGEHPASGCGEGEHPASGSPASRTPRLLAGRAGRRRFFVEQVASLALLGVRLVLTAVVVAREALSARGLRLDVGIMAAVAVRRVLGDRVEPAPADDVFVARGAARHREAMRLVA